MANHQAGCRDQSGVIALFVKMALSGSSALTMSPAAAQKRPRPPGSRSSASSHGEQFQSARGASQPRTSPIRGQPRAFRPRGPRYFTRIFPSIFQGAVARAHLPGGRIPATPRPRAKSTPIQDRARFVQPLGPTTTGTNAFFQSLGENGRSCVTCHLPPNAMSVSVDNIDTRWNATSGTDPIFAPIDGADRPNKVSLADRALDPRAAHSLSLDRGLFWISLAVPEGAEFEAPRS